MNFRDLSALLHANVSARRSRAIYIVVRGLSLLAFILVAQELRAIRSGAHALLHAQEEWGEILRAASPAGGIDPGIPSDPAGPIGAVLAEEFAPWFALATEQQRSLLFAPAAPMLRSIETLEAELDVLGETLVDGQLFGTLESLQRSVEVGISLLGQSDRFRRKVGEQIRREIERAHQLKATAELMPERAFIAVLLALWGTVFWCLPIAGETRRTTRVSAPVPAPGILPTEKHPSVGDAPAESTQQK